MTQVRVSLLDPAEIDEARVLAGLGAPGLEAQAWVAAATSHVADPARGGVLIARCGNGRACGLLHYAITKEGEGRACLQVERLVAFDLTQPGRIAEALIEDAVRLGRRHGCDRLKLVQPLDGPDGASGLIMASSLAKLHCVF